MDTKREIRRIPGGVDPKSKCSRCSLPPTVCAGISYDGHNRYGKSIRVESSRRFCERHGQKFAKRYGLKLPEVLHVPA